MTREDNVLPPPTHATPMLYWVAQGSARVTGPALQTELREGEVLWVPAGAEARVRSGWNSIVVPIAGLLAVDGPSWPVRIVVGASGRDAMIHAFGTSLGHLDAAAEDHVLAGIAELLRLQSARRIDPVWPTTPALVAWCRRALGTGTVEPPAGWTPRTLSRRLSAETGHTPSRWIREALLSQGADALARGVNVAGAAAAAGFLSTSGFIRAFRQRTGVSPADWVAHSAGHPSSPSIDLEALTDALPARSTWGRINSFHVAVWLVRGHGSVRVGSTELSLEAGDALVLPAGLPNDIDLEAGSVLLPVGFRRTDDGVRGIPRDPARIDEDAAATLLDAAIAAYADGDSLRARAGFDLVSKLQYAHVRPEHALLAKLAAAVPNDAVATLADCASAIGAAADLVRDVVAEETGLGFQQWQRHLRMSRARGFLWRGERAARVATDFGYAHQPAFTRAFREVHGRTPQATASAPRAQVPRG